MVPLLAVSLVTPIREDGAAPMTVVQGAAAILSRPRRRPSRGLCKRLHELAAVEVVVEAARREKLLVGPLLHYVPLVHD